MPVPANQPVKMPVRKKITTDVNNYYTSQFNTHKAKIFVLIVLAWLIVFILFLFLHPPLSAAPKI